MNIDLISGQIAKIHITLETTEQYELYGGTTRGAFSFERDGETWHVTAREEAVAGVPLCNYDIYARELSTGREWVILSGKIVVTPRTASVPADKLSPVEYFVHVPVYADSVDVQGAAIIQGIPGPKGERGEKGEPGEGGMTAEERALLNGAAQRDADNTFTAGNTFTGAVDMSTASVTPPEGWNVADLTPEAIQAVVPMKWGSYEKAPTVDTNGKSIAIGESCTTSQGNAVTIGQYSGAGGQCVAIGYSAGADPMYSVAIGCGAHATSNSVSVGNASESHRGAFMSVSVGSDAKTKKELGVTVGSQFTETTSDGNVTHLCTTEGTGSITIGAGANTLNNGTTESSNSVTIGCKASNKGADSVVIGAQARSSAPCIVTIGASSYAGSESVAIGGKTNANFWSVAIGYNAQSVDVGGIAVGKLASVSTYGTAIGCNAKATGYGSTAVGLYAKVSDYGATVIRSNAQDGTYTQLYFSGANTPLANTYENGAPMLGYVTKDAQGNVVAAGTRSLLELLTNNSTFAPASLNEDGEWVMPKVFHPSDLDMPTEEPSEPEEYTPLPVYPIVEPEIELLTE